MSKRKKKSNKEILHIKTQFEAIAREDLHHQRFMGRKVKLVKEGEWYKVYIIK